MKQEKGEVNQVENDIEALINKKVGFNLMRIINILCILVPIACIVGLFAFWDNVPLRTVMIGVIAFNVACWIICFGLSFLFKYLSFRSRNKKANILQ